MQEAKILIVGDELAVIESCKRALLRAGHQVLSVLTSQEAVAKLDHTDFDVVFFDLKLAGRGGREVLERLKEAYSTTPVVILHGVATISAAHVMGNAVYEFLPKPISNDSLFAVLGWALQQRNMLLQAQRYTYPDETAELGELIGTGPAMRALFRLINRTAPTNTPILIIGQKGTGKRHVAKVIHRTSPRRNEPMIDVNSENMQGVELSRYIFGTAPKEFRPQANTSKIEEAGVGTIYVDEITNLDKRGQEQLLSAVRKRSYTPMGGKEPQSAFCRFIIGTAEDLVEAVQSHKILDELYFNIDIYPIYLPSLAERSEDIPALTYDFMRKYARSLGRPVELIDDKLLTRLISRPWTGNLRELERAIERMVYVSDGEVLTLEHYRLAMEDTRFRHWDGRPPLNVDELKEVKKKLRRAAVMEVERVFVMEALQRSGGNVSKAAIDVGMQRRNFQTLMREYGINAW